MLQLRPEATVEVRGILERVLAIDPAQAQAFARLSIVAFADYANQWNDATPENMTKAMELARKAHELHDSEPQSHPAPSLPLCCPPLTDASGPSHEPPVAPDPHTVHAA